MSCTSGGSGGSSNPVQGKDVVFKIFFDDEYRLLLISKGVTLNTSAELVDVTSITDGNDPEEGIWKNYDYDSLSYTISLEGIMKVTDSANPTGWDLLNMQRQFLETQYQLVFTDESGNHKTVSGNVAIRNISFSVTPNTVVTQTFELQGLGKYQIT